MPIPTESPSGDTTPKNWRDANITAHERILAFIAAGPSHAEFDEIYPGLLDAALKEGRPCAVDRAWFKQHPNRRLYLRGPVPDELFALGYRCRDDAEKRGVIMLVGSLDEGVRVRIPVRAPPGVSVDTDLDLNKLDDATLLAALEQLAGDDETNKRIAQQLHERILDCVPFSERLAAQRRRKEGNEKC